MAKLVLTAIGDDRAGLVSALSDAVAERGGNWLESQLARLAGKFAGIALVEVPDAAVPAFEDAARALAASEGLVVTVTSAEDAASPVAGREFRLHVLGHDQPGIVQQVSRAVAERGITIDELSTSTLEAPMAGGLLFEADAVLRAPDDAAVDELQRALEALAGELMVDVELSASE